MRETWRGTEEVSLEGASWWIVAHMLFPVVEKAASGNKTGIASAL